MLDNSIVSELSSIVALLTKVPLRFQDDNHIRVLTIRFRILSCLKVRTFTVSSSPLLRASAFLTGIKWRCLIIYRVAVFIDVFRITTIAFYDGLQVEATILSMMALPWAWWPHFSPFLLKSCSLPSMARDWFTSFFVILVDGNDSLVNLENRPERVLMVLYQHPFVELHFRFGCQQHASQGSGVGGEKAVMVMVGVFMALAPWLFAVSIGSL